MKSNHEAELHPRSNTLAPVRSGTVESPLSSSPTRRGVLAGLPAALAVTLCTFTFPNYAETMTMTASAADAVVVAAVDPTGRAAEDTSIRPFQFHASDAALTDLRRRIAATKWPGPEAVTDASQGVQIATIQKLAHYWETEAYHLAVARFADDDIAEFSDVLMAASTKSSLPGNA